MLLLQQQQQQENSLLTSIINRVKRSTKFDWQKDDNDDEDVAPVAVDQLKRRGYSSSVNYYNNNNNRKSIFVTTQLPRNHHQSGINDDNNLLNARAIEELLITVTPKAKSDIKSILWGADEDDDDIKIDTPRIIHDRNQNIIDNSESHTNSITEKLVKNMSLVIATNSSELQQRHVRAEKLVTTTVVPVVLDDVTGFTLKLGLLVNSEPSSTAVIFVDEANIDQITTETPSDDLKPTTYRHHDINYHNKQSTTTAISNDDKTSPANRMFSTSKLSINEDLMKSYELRDDEHYGHGHAQPKHITEELATSKTVEFLAKNVLKTKLNNDRYIHSLPSYV